MTDNNSQDLTAMSAQPLTVEIGGKEYRISRPTLDDFGKLEQRIKEDRMAMLSKALKAAGEDRDFVASKMIEMLNSPVGDTAYRQALSSPHYLSYIIYLCISRHNPELEEQTLMEGMDKDDLNRIAAVLLSVDQSKNAKGATPKKRGRPAKKKE